MGDRPPILLKELTLARIPKTDREETLKATRQRLLEAAAVEFAHKGFAEANINHISQAAGFSKGTVYNYFPSKQSLMLALVAEAGAAHFEYIAGPVREVSGPVERLVRFYEAGFRYVEEFPAQARFLITTLYGPEAELQATMFYTYRPMFLLVAHEILTPGIEQGLFRAVDPLATSDLVMTIYLGTGSHVDAHGKVFMDPLQVADFVLHALQIGKESQLNIGDSSTMAEQ
jgi:AcrR family transcriptional regulator